MDPTTIVNLIELAAKLVQSGIDLYNNSQSVLSETDIAKIKATLAEVQKATAEFRPLVDAALDDAAKH